MRKPVVIAVLILIPVGFAHAQIPASERAALIALYNSTEGSNWTDNSGWLGPAGTECSWFGVDCRMFDSNPLDMYVYGLDLSGNQLIGTIPPELGNLTNMRNLYLSWNELTGSIPPELGNLSNARYIELHTNHLTGSIPAGLGNLPLINYMHLCCNQLGGEIPVQLANLTTILPAGLDISWNALHTDDPTLDAFLISKHSGGGDWESSQTVSPENVIVGTVGDHTVWLSWDYVTTPGEATGYHLFILKPGSSSWESVGWTKSIWTTSFPVTGLDPGLTYDIAVTTYTDPHLYNPYNLVTSDIGSPEMVTTATNGCAQPVIRMAGAGPYTLSVSGSWDTYEWSTFETTATIDVNPPPDEWFWVTVTSGGCQETAAILVDPEIFSDGFESGQTTVWSNTVP